MAIRINVFIPGYDIAGKNFHAEETGGDFFDIISTPEGAAFVKIRELQNEKYD
jgi:hypothetical protein